MSLSSAQQDVRDFHDKFGLAVGQWPGHPGEGTKQLRTQLIVEEANELVEALDRGDIPEVAKEAADLCYVVLGMCVSYGIDLAPVWEAVHESNMAKVGGLKSATGKILKPEGWKKPDITSLIEAQRVKNTSQNA